MSFERRWRINAASFTAGQVLPRSDFCSSIVLAYGVTMDLHQLAKSVEKHAKLDSGAAQRAVEAVVRSLRESDEATMIFRAVAGKSSAPEDRRTIHLCG
jgi:hypothetical protein